MNLGLAIMNAVFTGYDLYMLVTTGHIIWVPTAGLSAFAAGYCYSVWKCAR